MGRRPTRVAQVEVALEREADIATLAALLVSAMLLLYTIIKEARDIATDAANLERMSRVGFPAPLRALSLRRL